MNVRDFFGLTEEERLRMISGERLEDIRMTKIEVSISREELEQRWVLMNRQRAQIHIAMRNSALGAVCGNQEARDQYMALRERVEHLEREQDILGWALGELDQMEALERANREKGQRENGRSDQT